MSVTAALADVSAVGPALAVAWACAVAMAASTALRRSARRLPEPTAETGTAHTTVAGTAAAGTAGPTATGTAGTTAADTTAVGTTVAGTTGTVRSTVSGTADAAGPPATRALHAGGSSGNDGAAAAVNRAVASLGRGLRRLVGQGQAASPGGGGPTASERAATDRRTGWAALASSVLLVVAPALAVAPVTWAVAVPVVTARRQRARREASLVDQLPDVVDLLAVTGAAGLPVAASLVAIGARPGGPMGEALARAGAHVRHGGSTGEALTLLGDAGPAVRPLADALVQHDRYGTPVLPALQRVGIEARARRRRAAEEAARRLPVTLLFPLVLTTFPAFVLLTVVPLLAGSLGSLSLTPV